MRCFLKETSHFLKCNYAKAILEAELQICKNIMAYMHSMPQMNIGLYWPLAHEVNIKPLIFMISRIHQVLLPFVTEKNNPLEFRPFSKKSFMTDALGFSLPVGSGHLTPDIIFVPIIGVDLNGLRLGSGGGYYDRTSIMYPTIKTIGVGFSFQMCKKFDTDIHDQQLFAYISELGIHIF